MSSSMVWITRFTTFMLSYSPKFATRINTRTKNITSTLLIVVILILYCDLPQFSVGILKNSRFKKYEEK